MVSGKQDALSFDSEPTTGSNKMVTSGAIRSALDGKVDKVTGKQLSTNDFTDALQTKLDGIDIGAQVNVIEKITVNGTEIIPTSKEVAIEMLTVAVNNLANYYLKDETYTQEEVNTLINNLTGLSFDIVDELPEDDISASTMYMIETVPESHIYNQYMYINGAWANLGNTTIDLTNYYTKAQIDELLTNYQEALEFENEPTPLSTKILVSGSIYAALSKKQNTLEYDAVPTAGSPKMLTSGAIAQALQDKQDTLTIDPAPVEDSENLVQSGGVYSALASKQGALEFDDTPTQGSSNPVTSDGIKSALDNVDVPTASVDKAGKVKPDGTSITIDEDGTIHGAQTLTPGNGIDITDDTIFTEQYEFIGTKSEWDALSTTQKKQYTTALITDDEDGTDLYDNTSNLVAGDNCTLSTGTWQVNKAGVAYHNIRLNTSAELSESATICSGLLPAYDADAMSIQVLMRVGSSSTSGFTMGFAFIDNKGVMKVSGKSTIPANTLVCFSVPYLVAK